MPEQNRDFRTAECQLHDQTGDHNPCPSEQAYLHKTISEEPNRHWPVLSESRDCGFNPAEHLSTSETLSI